MWFSFPQKKLRKMFSIFSKVSASGLGKDSRIWTVFEIITLLVISIIPIKVEFLSCQIVHSFLFLIIGGFKFNSIDLYSSMMS